MLLLFNYFFFIFLLLFIFPFLYSVLFITACGEDIMLICLYMVVVVKGTVLGKINNSTIIYIVVHGRTKNSNVFIMTWWRVNDGKSSIFGLTILLKSCPFEVCFMIILDDDVYHFISLSLAGFSISVMEEDSIQQLYITDVRAGGLAFAKGFTS